MKKRKRRSLTLILGALLILVGTGIAGYPMVSSLLVEYRAGEEIKNYNQVMDEEQEDGLERMLEEARKHNDALSRGESVSYAEYDELLAVTDAIGYLEIPKIGVYLPIYHGLEDEVLQKGIGHIPETSLPVGGTSTHCVLSGHSGLPAARILTELDRMEVGDKFYLHVLDQTLAYEVDQITVVLPDETEELRIFEGKDYVTLLTCTPYGINTHRLLVRGERTGYTPQTLAVSGRAGTEEERQISPLMILWMASVAAGILLLLAGLLTLFVSGRRIEKKKED